MWKTVAILALFIGEALAIYGEIRASHLDSLRMYSPMAIFTSSTLIMLLSGTLLVLGYMAGYRGFQNIWIVMALSLTSILFLEPLVAYFYFRNLPSMGAMIGLAFGILGFVATFV